MRRVWRSTRMLVRRCRPVQGVSRHERVRQCVRRVRTWSRCWSRGCCWSAPAWRGGGCLRRQQRGHADIVDRQGPVAGDLKLFAYEDGFVPGVHQRVQEAVPQRQPAGERLRQRRRRHRQAARRVRGRRHQPLCRGGRRDGGQARSRAAARHLAHRELGPRCSPMFTKLPGVTQPDGQALHGRRSTPGVTGICYDTTKVTDTADLVQGPLRPQVQGSGRDDRLRRDGHPGRSSRPRLHRPDQPHATSSSRT